MDILSRRRFLEMTSTAVAAGVLAQTLPRQALAETHHKIGIQLYTVSADLQASAGCPQPIFAKHWMMPGCIARARTCTFQLQILRRCLRTHTLSARTTR
jgi:hypothetical protein